MRNRTEMVTNKIEGSDYDEEADDFEDSEEDWQPEKDDKGKKGVKAVGKPAPKSPPKKNGKGKAVAGGSAKKPKKARSPSPDEEELDEDEEGGEEAHEEEGSDEEPATKKSKKNDSKPGTSGSSKKSSAPAPKSFPDKNGLLTLYIFKGDLKDGIKSNLDLCLWRRDGSSLLQKYLRDKSVIGEPQYTSSMVYSCWEDRRSDEYLEIKVKCIDLAKQIRVELTNTEELESISRDTYEKHVAVHGLPPPRNKKNDALNETKPPNETQVSNAQQRPQGAADEEEDVEDEDVEEEEEEE